MSDKTTKRKDLLYLKPGNVDFVSAPKGNKPIHGTQ